MEHLRNRINFFKAFLSDINIGALTVSSRFVVDQILAYVPKHTRTIIEYGPGEGVVTRMLLNSMPVDGNLLAIEPNREFVTILRSIPDSRLRVIQGKAQDIINHAKNEHIDSVNFALASIPFSFLTPSERMQIVRNTHNLLAPNSIFIIFNYSPLMFKTMKKVFGNARITVEFRNIPPCWIMVAKK